MIRKNIVTIILISLSLAFLIPKVTKGYFLAGPIREAKTIDLISIGRSPDGVGKRWHGYVEFGRRTVTDKKTINQVAQAVSSAFTVYIPQVSQCFQPHHAVEVNGHYYVICFICKNADVDGKRYLINADEKDTFNQIWKENGLPISP